MPERQRKLRHWTKRREVHLRVIDPIALHEGKYCEGGTNSFAAR